MNSAALNHTLIKAIKNGDERTLHALYTANYDSVRNYVLRNNGTEEEAKDIYQAAFITTWRNIQLGKFKPMQNATIGGYIFQVARYKWLDYLRTTTVKQTVTLTSQHENVMTNEENYDINTERIEAIKENFSKLGEACREILTRYYFRKETMRDIAEMLSITEATAKNKKYRCMERLRSMINQ